MLTTLSVLNCMLLSMLTVVCEAIGQPSIALTVRFEPAVFTFYFESHPFVATRCSKKKTNGKTKSCFFDQGAERFFIAMSDWPCLAFRYNILDSMKCVGKKTNNLTNAFGH